MATEMVPGLGYLGSGYDIFTGNPNVRCRPLCLKYLNCLLRTFVPFGTSLLSWPPTDTQNGSPRCSRTLSHTHTHTRTRTHTHAALFSLTAAMARSVARTVGMRYIALPVGR